MEQIKVRFAPSPTGYLHIGGARTALFNWFFAKKHKGKLVLRIEDTDTERLKEDSVSQILSSMKWLGIDWDEGPEVQGSHGPYYQSERLGLYQKEIARLLAEGKAYYCFCTSEELTRTRELQLEKGEALRYNGKCRGISLAEAKVRIASGERPVVRLRLPDREDITVRDLIHGQVRFRLDQLDDLIIMKSNGIPAYNFACVVDDNAMGITHVIRAEEHLSNTPKQVLLYQALGYKAARFAHISMILAPDRSKLSKRHGATSVEEFREQGFLAPAIVNYLTFLGWSSGDEEEIITPEKTVERFSLDRVSKKAAIYDTKKLAWLNGHYLSSMDLDAVTKEAIPFLVKKDLLTSAKAKEQYPIIKDIIALVRTRVKTLVELADASEYFFQEVTEYEEKGWNKYFSKPEAAMLLAEGRKCLTVAESFDAAHLEDAYRQLAEKLAVKSGEIIHPTRLALTGRTVSPGLFEVMELLGKEVCLARMQQAIDSIVDRKN